MGGKTRRADATLERRLRPDVMTCCDCGQALQIGYTSWRKVATLAGMLCLKVSIGRCENRTCTRYHRALHPLEEGRLVLPHYEYGLDVVALIGALRYRDHATALQIHAALLARQVQISQRNVQYLLERYDELVALSRRDDPARRERLLAQGRLILAIDGLQPDVGQEVLWVVREVLSGEVLAARSLLSSCQQELAGVLREAVAGLDVPVVGVVSDGQQSIHCAVAEVFPGVPHQLCQFHYLKQAAGPAWEADRHAKKELKKRVRGIRPVERTVAGRDDEAAQVVQGYCAAVRGALTDEGKAPLEPGGLALHERLEMISTSLERAAQKRGACQNRSHGSSTFSSKRLRPPLRLIFTWIHQAAALLDNGQPPSGAGVRAQYQALLAALATQLGTPAGEAIRGWGTHFLKITQSYWAGLFHCYDVAGLPCTDNDLEHLFGTARHHERRITGRKVAAPSLIVRGPVRLLAAVISWVQPVTALQLAQVDPVRWREERQQLDKLRQARVLQRRFRHHPEPYLAALEERLVKLSLPP